MQIIFNFEKDISADATVGGVVNSISEAVTTVRKISYKLFQNVKFSVSKLMNVIKQFH